jgi:hypothetical protein
MSTYASYNINQKINAKANELIVFGRPTLGIMRLVKKNWITGGGESLKLKS